MSLVVRANYGNESIALLEALHSQPNWRRDFSHIYVIYIDTGWSDCSWLARVQAAEEYVKAIGFTAIRLKSKLSFAELVLSRQSFPSTKFQWCAGFLKGLPLLEWLDAEDPHCEWQIALPKRQALYRKPIPAIIEECEYHGERKVWHPILHLSNDERDRLIKQAGFSILTTRSLECQPCVNSRSLELTTLNEIDRQKWQALEVSVGKEFFPHFSSAALSDTTMDAFSMGCGDPFGCGL